MSTWPDIREAIARLLDDPRRALCSYPSPGSEIERDLPIQLGLVSTAEDVAADLHARFGDDVVLTVGALPYPPGRRPRFRGPTGKYTPPEEIDAGRARIAPERPIRIASGGVASVPLLLTNVGTEHIAVHTNGRVTGLLVDPSTLDRIGTATGPQRMPLVMFEAAPGEAVAVPMLVGTDSLRIDLGYVVPPGDWLIYAPLTIGSGPRTGAGRLALDTENLRTPYFPITVTTPAQQAT